MGQAAYLLDRYLTLVSENRDDLGLANRGVYTWLSRIEILPAGSPFSALSSYQSVSYGVPWFPVVLSWSILELI
jgi:hypothetical protein